MTILIKTNFDWSKLSITLYMCYVQDKKMKLSFKGFDWHWTRRQVDTDILSWSAG